MLPVFVIKGELICFCYVYFFYRTTMNICFVFEQNSFLFKNRNKMSVYA